MKLIRYNPTSNTGDKQIGFWLVLFLNGFDGVGKFQIHHKIHPKELEYRLI
jgi:hypothetical protein